MLLCEIGLHRWSFRTRQIDEKLSDTHTEVILARCRREGCRQYGQWIQVHAEAYPAARGFGGTARRSESRHPVPSLGAIADSR
jgi:hypothetical protein